MAKAAVKQAMSGYFQVLARVMGEPRAFFAGLSQIREINAAFGFLLVSSLFFAGASLLVHGFSNPAAMSAVLFTNALGMTLISAGLGYGLMRIVSGRTASFKHLFSVYAYASGTVYLAAWIPLALWVTEPWKWWLIWTGLRLACGLKWPYVLIIVAGSIGGLVLIFWAMMPIVR